MLYKNNREITQIITDDKDILYVFYGDDLVWSIEETGDYIKIEGDSSIANGDGATYHIRYTGRDASTYNMNVTNAASVTPSSSGKYADIVSKVQNGNPITINATMTKRNGTILNDTKVVEVYTLPIRSFIMNDVSVGEFDTTKYIPFIFEPNPPRGYYEVSDVSIADNTYVVVDSYDLNGVTIRKIGGNVTKQTQVVRLDVTITDETGAVHNASSNINVEIEYPYFEIRNSKSQNDINITYVPGSYYHIATIYIKVDVSGIEPDSESFSIMRYDVPVTVPPGYSLYMYSLTQTAYWSEGGGDNLQISGDVEFAGNIMSLLKDRKLYAHSFDRLFWNNAYITSAPSLPATILADYCYANMFRGCTSLMTAPELPATTLAKYCYFQMFAGCASLTSAGLPELPATTLAEECYGVMFNGCTSLTSIPELPATTLYKRCYYGMFAGCTSLITKPVLPATTLADECYREMFRGCISLTSDALPLLPATTLAIACYLEMFESCTSLTYGPVLPATTLVENCYGEMFWKCTSLTTAPALPATTLAKNCYWYMFAGCTSLTASPVLPATTLVSDCYSSMFKGCSSLGTITALFTNRPSSSYTLNWVDGVSSNGIFYKNSSAYWDQEITRGASTVPTNWTITNA